MCVGVSIARTGEQIYGEDETPLETNDDGIVKIHREEAEVFRPETIASFEGKPITITHPKEFVNPNNWASLAKGMMQNVRRGEGDQSDDLVADLLITDAMAIALVKNGLREVSCGYEAEYEQMGEGKGVQTNIVGNHLALVRNGRAGSSYAINDHKGESTMKKKLQDQIKKIFGKAQDEAMNLVTDADMEEKDEKDDKKKESKDAASYDELVQCVKDLGEKVESLSKEKSKDEEKPAPKKDDKKADKKDDAKDEESEGEKSLEDRLKALEAAVQKLLENKADEESDETDDEEGDEGDESEDDDFEETTMTGDSATDMASRAEILAPGLKATKDVKAKALKVAYATRDGKRIIDSLTGGKAPAYDSAEKVNTLFIAASELMKVSRTNEFSKSKQTRDFNSVTDTDGVMTAEKMNEINAKHYNRN